MTKNDVKKLVDYWLQGHEYDLATAAGLNKSTWKNKT